MNKRHKVERDTSKKGYSGNKAGVLQDQYGDKGIAIFMHSIAVIN